jgi:hypothetical protein
MTRQRKWQIKRKQAGLCIKCSKPAVVFLQGKRAGRTSVFCQHHLTLLREKNRANAALKKQVGPLIGKHQNSRPSNLPQVKNNSFNRLKASPTVAVL